MKHLRQLLLLEREVSACFYSGYPLKDAQRDHVEDKLLLLIVDQIQRGIRNFIISAEDEYQIIAGEIICGLKARYPQIHCIVIASYQAGRYAGLLFDLELASRAKNLICMADLYDSISFEKDPDIISPLGVKRDHLDFVSPLCAVLICYADCYISSEREFINRFKKSMSVIHLSEKAPTSKPPSLPSDWPKREHARKRLGQLRDSLRPGKRAVFAFRAGPRGNRIHVRNWQNAYGTALENELWAQIHQGIRDFIITLDNEFELVAGEKVIAIRAILPQIRCIVLLPHLENAFEREEWDRALTSRAKQVYAAADMREYFSEFDSPTIREAYPYYLYSLGDVLICYFNRQLAHRNATPALWMGLKVFNLYEKVISELYAVGVTLIANSLLDYFKYITNSDLICSLVAPFLEYMPYWKASETADDFFEIFREGDLPDSKGLLPRTDRRSWRFIDPYND